MRATSAAATDSRVMKLSDFLFAAKADTVNLFKLCRFMDATNMARKVQRGVLVVVSQPHLVSAERA